MPQAPVYEKLFTRDMCLGTMQTWCRAESTDPRQWTDKTQPFLPYCVFEGKNGLVDVYYDARGIDWIKDEMGRLLRENAGFVQFVGETFSKKVDALEPYLSQSDGLEPTAFSDFSVKIRDAWAWFEGIWWLIELLEAQGRTNELGKLMAYRKRTEHAYPQGDIVIRRSIARNYPSIADFAEVVLLEEAISKNMASLAELEKRKQHWFFTNNTLFSGVDKTHIEKQFNIRLFTPAPAVGFPLQGQSAFPGVVRGRVRKILRLEECQDLQKGEILVAQMTFPTYLAAIDRCAAIVTDEGGTLSHAAIVARELGKPCVMGTRFATALLQNGDEIEVDATNGIVRKI